MFHQVLRNSEVNLGRGKNTINPIKHEAAKSDILINPWLKCLQTRQDHVDLAKLGRSNAFGVLLHQ